MLIMIAAAMSVAQAPAPPDLDWMAGYWLSCDDGIETSETWSSRRGAVMLGTSITLGRDRQAWEQIRIEAGPDGVHFHAMPNGQPPAAFRLVRSDGAEALFENPGHDFPQRIIYRRVGDRLTGRIEGVANGRERAIEWHYRRAPLNTRCAPEGGAGGAAD